MRRNYRSIAITLGASVGLGSLSGAVVAQADPAASSTSSASSTANTTAPVMVAQATGVPPATPQGTTPIPNSTTPNTAPQPGSVPPMVAAQQQPKPKFITVSGFADLYFQHLFEGASPGTSLQGRIYSTRNDVPSIGLVWLDVAHEAPPNGFGGKVSLALGDDVDADHGALLPNGGTTGYTGNARYKNFQQLYVNYLAKNGFTARFGKYLSPYGYDTTESYLNPLFSVTLDTFLAPNYVEGLDISYPIGHPNLVLEGFLVNSLHQEQNGKTPDGILRLNYTGMNGRISFIPAVGFGTDNTFGTGDEKTLLWDNWLTFNATKALTLAGEYIYTTNDDNGGGIKQRADGYGLYLRDQLTPKNAVATRYSTIESHSNTVPATMPTSYRAWEVTAMYEYKVSAPLTTRLEFRHDHSSNPGTLGSPVFPVGALPSGGAATPLSGDANTLTLAALYNF